MIDILLGVLISLFTLALGQWFFRSYDNRLVMLMSWSLYSAVLAIVLVMIQLHAVPVCLLAWIGVSLAAAVFYLIAASRERRRMIRP